MRSYTSLFLKIFVKDYKNIKNPAIRAKYGYLEAWISIIGNIILSIIKLIFGVISNSIALMADAFHTLSDVITSLVVLVGFKASRRPADGGHPFGHGRTEIIATLILGVLLVIIGFDFLKNSINRIMHPQEVKGGILIIAILIVSSYLKEEMAIFSIDLGKKINASSLMADAWHHRTDAIASILVALAIIASIYKYFIIDTILGIGISILVIYVGGQFTYTSSSKLLGQAPSQEMLAKIKKQAFTIKGVNSVHDIEVHEYGDLLRVSLHIEVNNHLNVSSAHQIAEAVEQKLAQVMKITAVVHVDPKKI